MENVDGEALPIAIVGTDIAGVAAVINTLLDIAFNPDRYPKPVRVWVFDTKAPKPGGDSVYPLGGRAASELHPFRTAKPPRGFLTFGEYVTARIDNDPSLSDALPTPTRRQVTAYMERMLDRAVSAVAAGALMEFTATPIEEMLETATGEVTIVFEDGRRLQVAKVIRAMPAPYMAGPGVDEPKTTPATDAGSANRQQGASGSPSLRANIAQAVAASGLTFDDGATTHILIAVANRRIAVLTVELPEAVLEARITAILSRLAVVGADELWVVVPDAVGELLRSRIRDDRLRFLELPQFRTVLGTLRP